MKTDAFVRPARRLLVLLLLTTFCMVAHHGAQAAEQPAITSVNREGTNIAVAVRVPAGLRRITLECRERIGPGTWEPRAVARLDGAGGAVVFRLPRSRSLELMRVRADATDPLPAAFYTGTNSFIEQPSSSTSIVTFGPGGSEFSDGRSPAPEREVVESDIWKLRGETLYFFNQLRGLQVIDVSEPDTAVVRSTVDLPASGEDMYLLGSNHVVLLAGNGCGTSEGEMIVVADNKGVATITARLSVPGQIMESRLVGTALYVASQTYRPVSGTASTWEWGTLVSSFDLALPDAPAARGTLWRPGYGNVVTATDRLLFVVTQHPTNWWQSIVGAIDITSPDGTMHEYESITTRGRVFDKFKVQWKDGVLTTIAEDWRTVTGRTLTTRLETFRLPDPRSLGPIGVSKLGELELGRGERLHATRFDGDRVYVVTFFQIDPLWVVDLSTPSAPRIAGSVDVPGWSTFIQPLGSRLVTVGIETNRVAVSLFDVANPAAPALLSRVSLGERYSWSEANSDEKAFAVLPEAGLILVPYSGNNSNGYVSRVQLIDLNANSLAARGSIDHQFQPRRATVYSDRILSLSGAELLSVDATDRDNPVVRGNLALSWPVEQVFVQGDFVVELSGLANGGSGGRPVLRVASAAAPNDLLANLELTNIPVLGAATRGGRLYVLQGEQGLGGPILDLSGSNTVAAQSRVLLTVLALDQLPALHVLGETQAAVAMMSPGAQLQAVWPKPDLLVWAGGGFNRWWIEPYFRNLGPVADFGPSLIAWPWWGGGGGGQLIAFDVSNAAAPEFASELDLSADNRFNFSKAFAADGLVYLSHQVSEFYTNSLDATKEPDPTGTGDGIIAPEPSGTWISRSYLHVVDYADARVPLARQPVNIPGALKGISHQGAMLYTVGTHWTTNVYSAWTEFLDASSYDGVAAHLVDSMALPESWPRPVLVAGTNVFIGHPPSYGVVTTTTTDTTPAGTPTTAGSTNDIAATIETWHLADTGKLTRSGAAAVTNPAQTLVLFGNLLAAQQTDSATALFDATNGAALRRIGEGRPNGCYWFDLTRGDGDVLRGVWVPLGAYGVGRIPVDR